MLSTASPPSPLALIFGSVLTLALPLCGILYACTVYVRSVKIMKTFEGYKLIAVKERFVLAVNSIVERHRTAGQVLTWRLLHEIEKEALKTLVQAGDLDIQYIRMMRSSRWGYVPKIDKPAQVQRQEKLPIAVSLIHQAYQVLH